MMMMMMTPPPPVYAWVFGVFALVLGAVVGSFLNVCIYRMPLDLSVNEPRRSFCPHCRVPIAWYHNLPVFGWLWLRGRCAHCRQPIAVRYPLVELLTALLFLMVWQWVNAGPEWSTPLLAFPLWIFVALLIVGTFIDFDHLMIPDEITWGMVGAGLVSSAALPELMGESTRLGGALWSLTGATVGYGTLWAVVELGKLAFGKKRVVLPEPQEFTWTLAVDDAELVIGEERDRWSELFMRESDVLLLVCDRLTLAGEEHGAVSLRCFYNRVELAGKTYALEEVQAFSGRLREYVFPREAMGMGDVKLIAGIGAFLGWKAVFFSIAGASLVGSLVGVGLLVLGPKARSLRIPFGPYLSFGALLWMFAGPALMQWYLRLFQAEGL